MGRNIPAFSRERIHSDRLVLPVAFMCLTITATLAIISALCGARIRRKSNTSRDEEEPPGKTSPASSSSPPQPHVIPVPPPPARRQLDLNGSQSMKPPKSNGMESSSKISSMSMRVGRSLSMSMRWSRKEASAAAAAASSSSGQKMKAKLEKEDSIWMKTIILGEKCRVEDEDDPVIFDDRGFKVTAYHPKAPSSLPVSRTSSYIDQDAIPTSWIEQGKHGIN